MRRILVIVLFLVEVTLLSVGQLGSNTARRIISGSDSPPATCGSSPADVYVRIGATFPGLYVCLSTNSFTGPLGSAGSGFPQFLTANLQSEGIAFNDPTIGQGGTLGSTFYIYCVVATDTYNHTRTTCFDTGTGNATLTGSNFNTVTVGAYSSSLPYILPVGSCNIYRTVGGATQGKIGTLSNCASGGIFNDTGFVGDSTSPPVDTSGIVQSAGPGFIGQVYVASDEASLYLLAGVGPSGTPAAIVTPGYTHNVIVAGTSSGVYANSGITAVGFDGNGNAHACTAIGYGTVCNSDSSFFAGIGAGGTGGSTIGIGQNAATSASGVVAIGASSNVSGGQGVAIGHNATVSNTNSVAIGVNSASTAVNQFIAGGPNITEFYAGTATGGSGTQANVNGQSFTTTSFYSAAGTAIPTCNASNKARMVAVSDNTAITPGVAYASGGTFTNWVQCTFNSSGSVFSWVNL